MGDGDDFLASVMASIDEAQTAFASDGVAISDQRVLRTNPSRAAGPTEGQQPLQAKAEFSDPLRQIILAHERNRSVEDMLDATNSQNPEHLEGSAVRLPKARSDVREPLAPQELARIEVLIKEYLSGSRLPCSQTPCSLRKHL